MSRDVSRVLRCAGTDTVILYKVDGKAVETNITKTRPEDFIQELEHIKAVMTVKLRSLRYQTWCRYYACHSCRPQLAFAGKTN